MNTSEAAEEFRKHRVKDLKQQIHRNYKELNGRIEELGERITKALTRHEQDYLSAFQAQLCKVTNEFKELKKEMKAQAVAFDTNQTILRLKAAMKELSTEANRLAGVIDSYRQQSITWKHRAEELEAENNFLSRKLTLLHRKHALFDPEKSVELSAAVTSSTAVSPCCRSGENDDKPYLLSAVCEIARKYGIEDKGFVGDCEAVVAMAQRPLQTTVRHLQQTLANTQKQVRALTCEKARYFSLQSDLQQEFQTCVDEVKRQSTRSSRSPKDRVKALELLCESEQFQSEVKRILFPLKTPVLSSMRGSLTPNNRTEVLITDYGEEEGKTATRTPGRRLKRRSGGPVVIRGKLLIGSSRG